MKDNAMVREQWGSVRVDIRVFSGGDSLMSMKVSESE